MKPQLIGGEFVFCTITENEFVKLGIKPILMFKEDEGITIIIKKEKADENALSYSNVWRLITLSIHSDLGAIGFLAAITKKLAENGISVNVVSAYYHDHLFVPLEKAEKTIQVLNELSSSK